MLGYTCKVIGHYEQNHPRLLNAAYSVVCLYPQAHSNKLQLTMFEALHLMLVDALVYNGKEWPQMGKRMSGWALLFLLAVSLIMTSIQCFHFLRKRDGSI